MKTLVPTITEDDVKCAMGRMESLAAEIRVLRDTFTQKDGDVVKHQLLEKLEALMLPDGLSKVTFLEKEPTIERLRLLSAAIPDEGPGGRRALQLMAAEFLESYLGLGWILQECSKVAESNQIEPRLVTKLNAIIQKLPEETDTDLCVSVMKALQTSGATAITKVTSDALASIVQNLINSGKTILSKWKDEKAHVNTCHT